MAQLHLSPTSLRFANRSFFELLPEKWRLF